MSAVTDRPLRMRDVCARTGLARSTIHHYIREGVLPPPRKTGRNTAVYDEDFVRRVRLVRALQERTRMPLAAIRETLNDMPDDAVGRIDPDRVAGITGTIADELRLASERPLSRAELLEQTGLHPAELDGLAAVGLLDPNGADYSPLDARVAMAFARIRSANHAIARDAVGAERIVRAYHKHLTALARAEAREMVRLLRTLAEIDVDDFVRRTVEPLGELIEALHRKALVGAITAIVNDTKHARED